MDKVWDEAGGVVVGLAKVIGYDVRGEAFDAILGDIDLAHDSIGLGGGFVTSAAKARVLDELQDDRRFASAQSAADEDALCFSGRDDVGQFTQ